MNPFITSNRLTPLPVALLLLLAAPALFGDTAQAFRIAPEATDTLNSLFDGQETTSQPATTPSGDPMDEAAARHFFEASRDMKLPAGPGALGTRDSLNPAFKETGAIPAALDPVQGGLSGGMPRETLLTQIGELDACLDKSGGALPTELPEAAKGARAAMADWTVLLYMAYDASDLESDLKPLIANMEQIGSTRQANVVALVDTASWQNARLVWIQRWQQPSGQSVVDNRTSVAIGPVNTGSPRTLAAFIQWGLKTFPSRKRALIIDGHGGGWRDTADGGDVQWLGASRDVAYDETSGNDPLTSLELRQALYAGHAAFNLIVFSSCLMGMTEVAYDLRGYCDMLVASEEIMYGTPDFAKWLYAMNRYSNVDSWNAAAFMLWAYKNRPVNQRRDQTLAAAVPQRMAGFVRSLNTVVKYFAAEAEAGRNVLQTVQTARQHSGSEMGTESSGGQRPHIDIGTFLYIVSKYDGFAQKTRHAATYAFKQYCYAVPMMVSSRNNTRTGHSVFFPRYGQSNTHNLKHYTPQNILFANVCLWAPFMRSWAGGQRSLDLGKALSIPDAPAETPEETNLIFSPEGIRTQRDLCLPEALASASEPATADASASGAGLEDLFSRPDPDVGAPSVPPGDESLESLFE